MGDFAKWLLAEEQKELFEQLYADALTLVFLGLAALVLWPLGNAGLVLRLAAGYGIFWLALSSLSLLLILFRRIFRVDMYSHFDAYVISAIVVSGFAQVGWSAFAALTITDAAAGAGVGTAVALYVVGFLSSYVAFAVVTSYYGGSIYRMINLPLAVATFVLFCFWPAAARFLYGWFFDLF